MTKAWGGNNQWQEYAYDGDGRRVKRKVDGTETWQVYGLGGELLAEYGVNGVSASPQKEYGYRNGQMLITATAGNGWGNPPTFSDDPLTVAVTEARAIHLTELRDAVNQLRVHAGLPAASWAESITSGVFIKADHISELRTKLDEALVALGQASGGYSTGLGIGFPIQAIHLQELRDRLETAWSTGSSPEINWLVADQLGTPRMIFDQTGSLANMKRHDYLPFGEELFTGTGGRTPEQGYTASDNVRQKFTLKERDIETGLDYFGARYYSSAQGRFTSTDKPFADQFHANPQSWNTYSYVRNSPCNNIDAKGRCTAPAGLKPGQVGICIEAFIAAKTFKGLAQGDNRTHSGNKDLAAKFRTDIIISRSDDDPRKFNISQKTEAGTSRASALGVAAATILNPLAGVAAVVGAKGTAETTLNGVKPGSDGSSQTTVPLGSDGVVRFNVSTTAVNGFNSVSPVDQGSIRSSFNIEANPSKGLVQIDADSQASGYPSFSVWSYAYENGNMVTKQVWKFDETSPDALHEPMKPIPDQTRRP